MNASLPDLLRCVMPHLRAMLLVAAIPLLVGVAWAQTRIDPNGVSVSGSVIGDDVPYSIGGGRAVSMGGAGNMQGIGVGVGWNSNLICGDMSITRNSHPIVYVAPDGVTFSSTKPTEIKIAGINKQQLGQIAAEIRGYRPPEPYKGKGVRYAG